MAEYMHPVVMERNAMVDVVEQNRFFVHRPNIETIMSEEKMQCGDMDCDGGKKANCLIKKKFFETDSRFSSTMMAAQADAASPSQWSLSPTSSGMATQDEVSAIIGRDVYFCKI